MNGRSTRTTGSEGRRVLSPREVAGKRRPSPCGRMEPDLPPPLASRLERLTPDQRVAALAPPGPVLCVAPAGSGKTTTVVARIAWRIVRGAPPATICALTFNRRAADELGERVEAALAELGDRRTQRGGQDVPCPRARDTRRRRRGRHRHRRASRARRGDRRRHPFARRRAPPRRRLLAPEARPGGRASGAGIDAWTVEVFEAYQGELARRGALDLDDLVARAAPTLLADPDLLARWRSRCATLFVDEAQDLDRAQLELVLVLAGDAATCSSSATTTRRSTRGASPTCGGSSGWRADCLG